MLGQRRQSLKAEEFLREPTPPSSWLGKAKYYYDLYNCRYFAPFLLLFLYSILGAWVFHLVEYENEKEMKVREVLDLDRLRTNAFQRIVGLFQARKRSERLAKSKDLLLWYENELQKVKLPEALEWDMWGALFYVGTIFTTIGYGNIVPRTITGRALSVVYAIIGIPLVLAILSRFGQFLEHNIARVWLKHREKIKEAHKQTRKRISTRVNAEVSLYALEEGKLVGSPVRSESFEDRLIDESRTIPIWLALLICISWICACAGLFLIWEKRWTFFTSLYFFFISLSTIGLGDVVPDHPHMLILMFWLVIIGLSIVSMLLAVIQIKFEECLYNFMIRMQEEYQRNLANGLPLNHEEIRKRAMEDQPFLMKLFGPDLISDSQMEKIEEKAEQFERITRSLNNKNIQTEIPAAAIAETQVEKTANSIACDPMTKSDSSVVDGEQIPWSKDVSAGINEEHLTGRCADEERDSMSDATSLPLDSISCPKWKPEEKNSKRVVFVDDACCARDDDALLRNTAVVGLSKQAKCVHVQTDIAQFQIDEIVLRLAALQANRDLLDDEDVQPALFCAGRRGRKKTRLDSIGEKSVRDMSDKEILTTMLQMMTRSMETDPIPQKIIRDQGVNTETHPLVSRGMNTYPTLCRTQSIETDVNDVVNRSVATDATILVNRSMETSRQESVELTNMPWDEKVYRDMMTSPILQRLLFKTTGTAQQSVSSGDIQVVDEFQQTSLSIDRPRPMADQTVQTSMSIDRPLRSVVDQLVQTSISITLPSGADQSLQTSVNTDTPPQRSVSDQSLQTSMNTDRLQRSVADQSVQTSISTDAPPRSVADQSVQTSISTDITLSSSADQSLQTSMNTDRPQRSVADQSLQASLSIDTPPRSAADQSVQTSISMDLTLSSCVGQSLETSMNTDTPPQRSFTDQSVQASISGDITLLSLVDQSLQRSLNTDTTTRRLSECHFSSQFSPDVVDKVTSPMIFKLIDRSAQGSLHELANKSQQTSTADIVQLLERSNTSEFQSLDAGPHNEIESHHSDTCCNSRASTSYYEGRMADSMEMSTQYSPQMSRSAIAQDANSLGIINKRARSSSTSGIGNSIYDDETRQEVIIQTDDSYLKLARRLDEYRSNRTQFLPVVAASPLGSRDIEPFKGDRPSERCGYYLDIKGVPRRRSIKLHQRGSQKTNNADSQTGASLELEPIASSDSDTSNRKSSRKE